MDDIAEQQDVASEISDAISNPVGFSQDVDDVSTGTLYGTFNMDHDSALLLALKIVQQKSGK